MSAFGEFTITACYSSNSLIIAVEAMQIVPFEWQSEKE